MEIFAAYDWKPFQSYSIRKLVPSHIRPRCVPSSQREAKTFKKGFPGRQTGYKKVYDPRSPLINAPSSRAQKSDFGRS
jgi:hypothetical protein